jgi:hypothetical protein
MAAAVQPEAKSWDYSHAPLDVQLDRGVRSFELDLHLSPAGWEVYHLPAIDNQTSCRRFTDGLRTVRDWSDKHVGHAPISFLLELKEEGLLLDGKLKRPDAAALDALDGEIRSVFSPKRLITPDDVRGDQETLEQAVLAKRWPTLSQCQGRVFFILHERGAERDLYSANRPSLQGRAMFVNSAPGRSDAAVLVMDNPNDPEIPERVRQGYLIRTRADSTGSTPSERRREKAFASGAHIVSTDYPPGEALAKTGYVVRIEAGAARVNPVAGPEGLRASVLPEPVGGRSANASP